MDYDLSGLSPRSFEHLVQSLALKAITPTLSVFGDGPDGGREATFDGPTDYGPRDARWEGYGVIQAKFLQRSRTPSQDGRWAITELTRELSSFEKSLPTRRTPQYYIFATNVVLSPVEGAGAKDRVEAILAEFSRKHGLLAFDVWDYDKFRTLLDNNLDVRSRYAAWISAGDILEEMREHLRSLRPDFESVLSRFLQQEFLVDMYARLEQAGHSPDEKIPLSQVFVDLPVATKSFADPPARDADEPDLFKFVRYITTAASERYSPNTIASAEGLMQARGAGTSARIPGRCVLIGGPGQGKTTLGQYICQYFRAAYLRRFPTSSVAPDVSRPLRSFLGALEKQGLDEPSTRRLPIRVVLSELATALAGDRVSSVLDFIGWGIGKRTTTELSGADVRELLIKFPCIVVFDGLDEVPASSNRSETLERIREFLVDIWSAGVDAMVVATSRPQGYNDDFSPDSYLHLWLVPLNVAQAVEYGDRLVNVRFGTDPERVARVCERLRRAADAPATARLMRSPLQVTIMTLLVDRSGQPPQERWALFRDYYYAIYQRELERDIPAADVLRDQRANIDAIHRSVGLLLQVESERSGTTDARLTVEQLTDVVDHRLKSEGYGGAELETLSRAIIEGASQRLVFLVGIETGQVGFEIRSLQEFMAAEGMMDGSDDLTRARLKAIAPISSWRNVFLFAAGKCFSDRQYLRDVIVAVCSELNEDPDDPAVRLTLAGSELALDLLEEGSVRRQPRINAVLSQIALRLSVRQPGAFHRRLAGVYDRSAEAQYRESLAASLESEVAEMRAGSWACLAELVDAGHSEFDAIASGRLAAGDLADSHLFGVVLRHSYGNSWLASELVERLPSQSPAVLHRQMAVYARGPAPWPKDRPSWVEAVDELLSPGPTMQRIALSLSAGSPQRSIGVITLPSVDGSAQGSAPHIAAMKGASPEWASLIRCIEFAVNPSKASLGVVLRAIADAHSDENASLVRRVCTWPILVCLNEVSSLSELHAYGEAAEDGELGDVDQWRSAEANWHANGIAIDDLLRQPRHARAVLSTGAFPISAAALTSSEPDGVVVLGEAFVAACATPDVQTQRALGLWFSDAILDLTHEMVAENGTDEDGIAERALDGLPESVLVRLIELLDEGEYFHAEYFARLVLGIMAGRLAPSVRLGSHAVVSAAARSLGLGRFGFGPSPSAARRALAEILGSGPSTTCLEIVGSAIVRSTETTLRVPEAILDQLGRCADGEDPDTCLFGIAVRLAASECDDIALEEARSLIRRAPWLAYSIVRAIARTTSSHQNREAALAELFEETIAVPSSSHREVVRQAVVRELTTSLQERQSRVGNADLWSDLGFDPELVGVLA